MQGFIIIILLLLAAFLIFTLIAFVGANHFRITFARLPHNDYKKDVSVSPLNVIRSRQDLYRKDIAPEDLKDNMNRHVIFISDLHAEMCFMGADRFCDIVTDINSHVRIDAVVFGGDICNKAKSASKGINWLKAVSGHLKSLEIPFIGVTGNHDIGLTPEQIAECGFYDLSHGPVEISRIIFSGVRDSGRENRVWAPNPVTETNGLKHVLVSHNPDWILNAYQTGDIANVDHVLSGHIHGGQLRMPFNFENAVIRKDILPKHKIIKGIFELPGMSLFISRGLGCVIAPFRFLSDPEITIVEFD